MCEKKLGSVISTSIIFCIMLGWTLKEASADGIKLSLKLHGGYSYLAAGDINGGTRSEIEWAKFLFDNSNSYTAISGDYKPVHGGYDFGADLLIQFSTHFGMSIGIGYLRSSRISSVVINESTQQQTTTASADVSAVPIQLGLLFRQPVARKMKITTSIGMAYYTEVKFNSKSRVEYYWPID